MTGSLLVEGFITLVELTGVCPCSVCVALLVKVARTGLPIGKAGNSNVLSFELKGKCVLFHPSACSSK